MCVFVFLFLLFLSIFLDFIIFILISSLQTPKFSQESFKVELLSLRSNGYKIKLICFIQFTIFESNVTFLWRQSLFVKYSEAIITGKVPDLSTFIFVKFEAFLLQCRLLHMINL